MSRPHLRRKHKQKRADAPPCTCGLYRFPHRYTEACDAFEREREERRHRDEEHKRDLQTWANLSRG